MLDFSISASETKCPRAVHMRHDLACTGSIAAPNYGADVVCCSISTSPWRGTRYHQVTLHPMDLDGNWADFQSSKFD